MTAHIDSKGTRRVLVVVPARYASTRFPGKPLALLSGKPVLRWVCESLKGCGAVGGRVVVATDDQRIAQACATFGAEAMLTSVHCQSGTDRCGEVLQRIEEEQGEHYDVVLNVQGDEPFVDETQLRTLVDSFDDAQVQIATLATEVRTTNELLSPNNVKVVVGDHSQALYFSRQPIPYRRGVEPEQWLEQGRYLKHVGIYAYRSEVLRRLCHLPPSALELAERLEQLRWLAAGYSIHVSLTSHTNIGIDTPADLVAAEEYIRQNKKQTE